MTYHSVGPSRLGLPRERFRQQMEWLRKNVAVVSLNQLLSGHWPESSSGISCAMTFDDGYASVYRSAFPVLQEFGIPATVYLVGNAIGDAKPRSSNEFPGLYPDEDMLLWSEVREMQQSGLSFGSHLLHHKDLTSLNPKERDEELAGSKRLIEDRIGAECASFCYPWGKHDEPSIEAVKKAHYKDAVVAIQGRWKRNQEVDQFRIPRADIRRDYEIEDFAAVVRGDWDYLGLVQKARRLLN